MDNLSNDYYSLDDNIYYNKCCSDFVKPLVKCNKCDNLYFYNEIINLKCRECRKQIKNYSYKTLRVKNK